MKIAGAAFLSCLLLATAAPPAAAREAAGRDAPDLVVTIVVDQFSANLFNQHRARWTGGLARLTAEGLIYANGYQAHAVTETCPGHSTILTGAHPTHTGIPANDWIDPDTGEEIYCLAAPANAAAPGDAHGHGPVGPDQLRVSTLSDWLKAASPHSRVYTVSGKDRGAINLGGHQPDGAFWYVDGFGFTTYLEPGQTAERRLAPVRALNARIAARLAANPPSWTYRSEDCRRLADAWTIGARTFHSQLPPAHDELDGSPLLDELTLEAAAVLLEEQQLGRRGVTDLLGISLSATDRIGHAYGSQGPEMCEQMHRLDAALGAFLTRLDDVPGGVLVVLTADHGGADFPERLAGSGPVGAVRADPTLLDRLNAAMMSRFALSEGPLTRGGSGLMVHREDDYPLVARAAVALLRQEPQIAGAWTVEEVLASPLPAPDASPEELTLLERERLSVVAGRSPDVILAFRPNVNPSQPRLDKLAGHGTPWDYDRRVPIVFWTPGGTGAERATPARTVDIAPTLAHVLALPAPDTVDGRCLELGLFDAAPCPSPEP